ncbi:MAG: hypothetical protein JWR58_5299, partial [Pseudonocardia sp.]|nr:hypothetical protein [Pseudonocardia sp.]
GTRPATVGGLDVGEQPGPLLGRDALGNGRDQLLQSVWVHGVLPHVTVITTTVRRPTG